MFSPAVMTNCSMIIVLVIITFSTINAIAPFIPKDKELLYDYAAIIRSATDIPDQHSSEFYLYAKLRIQSPSDTSLLVQLTNVTYKLYNGPRNVGYKQQLSELPIPTESAAITEPFEVLLKPNGQAKSINTAKSEDLNARNMHKALASLLQLKLDVVNLTSDTFITQEHSIYGKGRAVYSILPKGEQITIKKLRESVSHRRMYQLETTNFEGDVCEAAYEEPLAHNSQQFYTLKKTDGDYFVTHIESNGGLYFYPFKAKSEAHFIHSSISINFISATSISAPIKIHNTQQEKDLTYDISEPGSLEQDNDDTVIVMLQGVFDEILQYFHKNHMQTDNIDILKAHLSTTAVRLLRTCSFEKLDEVYNKLSSKKHIKLFQEVIPFVGTHSSVVFVKKLVHDRKVDDSIALDMIQVVASYTRFPTESLLRDTEDMLNWGEEFNKDIRKTAALAFGTLIHKTFKSEVALATREHEDTAKSSTFHQQGSHASSQEADETKFLKEHTIYQKYIDILVNKLKSSTDVESQLLYLQVIFNTKLSLAVPHLIPIVKGEELQNHDIREMSLWALSHMLLNDPDLIVKLYWPIVTDSNEHTELRIAAYYIIIKARPSLTGMLNLHYALQNEMNSEVYNFHYTYLQAMSQSNDPCNEISKLNAAQTLKFVQKPTQQALSRYYQTNFNDPKYGHGYEISGLYITAARSRILVADINLQRFNKKSNYYLLFFKIGGLEKQLSRTLEFNLKNSFGLLNYAEIWNTIMSARDMKDFHIQASISNNHHTTRLYYFNKNNLHELHQIFQRLLSDQFVFDETMLNINFEDATEVIFPTEIGMPASLEMLVPTMTYKQLKLETKVQNNVTKFLLDSRLQGLRSISWGLDFYNPILSVSQGIKRYHAYDSVLPLFMEVSIKHEQQALSIAWKTHINNDDNIVGIRSYVTNFVYIEDYTNKSSLQASCSQCKNWVQVTRGDAYRYNYTVLNDNGLTTGFATTAIIFDTERHANTDSLSRLIHSNRNEARTNFEDFLTFLRNFHLSDIFQPSPGTQGFLAMLHPAVSQLDMVFSFKEELTQQQNEFLPGIKFNPHLKYQLQINNSVVKTLDFDAVIETNIGHTLQNVNVEVASTTDDFKICINGSKMWRDEGITGYYTVSTSRNLNDECRDIAVSIITKGEQLQIQKSPYHVYEVCDSYSHTFKPDYHWMRCLAEHTSIRKYMYDIKVHPIPPKYVDNAKDLFFFFMDKHNVYHNYYTGNAISDTGNSINITLEYINENEANFEIITPQGTHELIALPVNDLFWLGLRPDNTHFSSFFLWMNYMGMVNTCVVRNDEIQFEFNEEKHVDKFPLNGEWTRVIVDAEPEPQFGIFLKQYRDNMLSLKIDFKNQSMEINPLDDEGEQFRIMLNGEELSQVMDHYKEDWFIYLIRPHHKSIILTVLHFQLHLDYTASQLIIQVPKVNSVPLNGPCSRRNVEIK